MGNDEKWELEKNRNDAAGSAILQQKKSALYFRSYKNARQCATFIYGARYAHKCVKVRL